MKFGAMFYNMYLIKGKTIPMRKKTLKFNNNYNL